MKKVAAICGMGFGSSFVVEMNIKKVLKELGLHDVEVEHTDLGSAYEGMADLLVCGRDLEDNCKKYGDTLSLTNIFDKAELHEKMEKYLKDNNIIK